MIYLGILLVLLGCMGMLDAKGKLVLFSHPVRGILALVLGTGFFVLWDVLAIKQGIFVHKDSDLMTGIMVGDQFPVEELFFLLFLCYSSMIAFAGLPVLARSVQHRRRSNAGHGGNHVS